MTASELKALLTTADLTTTDRWVATSAAFEWCRVPGNLEAVEEVARLTAEIVRLRASIMGCGGSCGQAFPISAALQESPNAG